MRFLNLYYIKNLDDHPLSDLVPYIIVPMKTKDDGDIYTKFRPDLIAELVDYLEEDIEEEEVFHKPFSPTIMEMEVPQKFIDIVNKIGDEVLSDDTKSAQWDWSNHLVGKVHKEVQIPIVNKRMVITVRIFSRILSCYLKHMIGVSRAYIDNMVLHHPKHGNLHPTDENINMSIVDSKSIQR